ncbi:MAG: PaaI family thioesterase [Phycisphaerales bacterium]|nr:PaaI family thioesterase [Phycisphaerales bacterium]
MTTDLQAGCVPGTTHHSHARCIVCGWANPLGLRLAFRLQPDGRVEATFGGNGICEGYPNRLHGGVISLLLDGAMTNCLFAHQCTAVTAKMEVKFRYPVKARVPAIVRAWIEKAYPPLYRMKAELEQEGQTKATASALFMEQPELDEEKAS